MAEETKKVVETDLSENMHLQHDKEAKDLYAPDVETFDGWTA